MAERPAGGKRVVKGDVKKATCKDHNQKKWQKVVLSHSHQNLFEAGFRHESRSMSVGGAFQKRPSLNYAQEAAADNKNRAKPPTKSDFPQLLPRTSLK